MRRAASWRSFFRVAEIRARSTPQLVAVSGILAGLCVVFPWATIARIQRGGEFDVSGLLLLVTDLGMLACLPGLGVAVAEVSRRSWRLVTTGEGSILSRVARATVRFSAEARLELSSWLDGRSWVVALSFLVTPVLAVAVGACAALGMIRSGLPVDRWFPGAVIVFLVFCAVPITVPAAVGSLVRRIRGETRT